MPDPRETLARIRAQADAATDGPWDHEPPPGPGEDPMRPICVYPKEDGGTLAYVQPLEADAAFIAASRTNVPALLDLADAVLERHVKAQPIPAAYGTQEGGDYCAACADDWPCTDYTAATTALEATK